MGEEEQVVSPGTTDTAEEAASPHGTQVVQIEAVLFPTANVVEPAAAAPDAPAAPGASAPTAEVIEIPDAVEVKLEHPVANTDGLPPW